MEKFETFSTTADVGVKIQGKGFSGLFISAVKGLNLLLFGDNTGSPANTGPAAYLFEYRGDSAENVLVNLLSEILFLLQNRDKITTGLEIKKIEENYLKAELLLIDSNLLPEMEIKSVTYHNLHIRDNKGVKYAEIVFDI